MAEEIALDTEVVKIKLTGGWKFTSDMLLNYFRVK